MSNTGHDFLLSSKKALIREIISQRQKILDDLKATENSILVTIESSRTAIHRTLLEAQAASARLVHEFQSNETTLWRSLQKRELAVFQLHLGYGDVMQGIAGMLKEKQLAVEEERQSLVLRRQQLEKWAISVQHQLFSKETELTMLQRTLDEDIAVFAAERRKDETRRKAERREFAKLKRVVPDYELATPEIRGSTQSASAVQDHLVVVEGDPVTLQFQIVVAADHREQLYRDSGAAGAIPENIDAGVASASSAKNSSRESVSNPSSQQPQTQQPDAPVGQRFYPNVYASATFLIFPGETPPDVPPAKISPQGTVTFPRVILAEGNYTLQVSIPRVSAGITRAVTISIVVIAEEILQLQFDKNNLCQDGVLVGNGSVLSAVPLARLTLWALSSSGTAQQRQLQLVTEIDFCGASGSRAFTLELPQNTSDVIGCVLEAFYTLHHFPTRLLRSQYRVSLNSTDNVLSVQFMKNLQLAQSEIAPIAVDLVPFPAELCHAAGLLSGQQVSPSGRLVALSMVSDPQTVVVTQWNGNVRHPSWSPPSKLTSSGATVVRFFWSSDSRWLLCATRDNTRSNLRLCDCINLGELQAGMTTTTVLALPLGLAAQDVAQVDCLDRSVVIQTIDGSVHLLSDRLAPSSVANGYGFVEICSDALTHILHDVADSVAGPSRRCTVARRGAQVSSFTNDGKLVASAQLPGSATVFHAKILLSPLGIQVYVNSKFVVCLHDSKLSVLDHRFVRAAEVALCPSGTILALETFLNKETGGSTMIISSRVSEFWCLSSKKPAQCLNKKFLHSTAVPSFSEIVAIISSPSGELELIRARSSSF